MLVGERMTYPVVSVHPDMPINEALTIMRREKIRRTPVVKDGKLVGIVSDKDLLNASPSPVTSLSIWEMNYLLSKIQVKDVMSKDVKSVTEDTPIEEAARMLADNKIGGLPVVRDGEMVGIITETDLFKLLLELTGAREVGVRCTVVMPNTPGQLATMAQEIASMGANIIAIGTYLGSDPSNRKVTFKVSGVSEEEVIRRIQPLVKEISHIRTC